MSAFRRTAVALVAGTILVGPVLATSPAQASGPTPRGDTRSCLMSRAGQWFEKMGKLATPTTTSWVNSDGMITTRLPGGDILFMMGDTLWGTKKNDTFTGGHFVRNTAMVYHPKNTRGRCFTTFAGKISNGVLYTGNDKAEKRWYWPGKSIPMRARDTTVYMFGNHMVSTGNTSMSFAQTGTTLFKMKYQPGKKTLLAKVGAWNLPYLPGVPTSQPLVWGWSTLTKGNYVYVYGARWRQAPWVFGRDLYVARLPLSLAYSHPERTTSWQYWTTTGWRTGKPTLSDLSPILENAVGAGGTVTMNAKGKIQITTRPFEFLDNRVVTYTSSNPHTGFAPHGTVPVTQPTSKWMYNAQAHPEVPAPAGKQWVSVDVNTAGSSAWPRPSEVAPHWLLIPAS